MKQNYAKARKLMNQTKNVLIVSHRQPDADTLGAAIALRIYLSGEKRNITMACIDTPGPRFDFLPYVEEFVDSFDLKAYDLMIIVDAGASYMTNFQLKYDNFFSSGLPIINIDHHASNGNYGDLNIVDPGASSATVILYRMFKEWRVEIDEGMATSLLAGIYNDTGSFMHSNTNAEVLEIAADLLECGASIGKISNSLFGKTQVSTLRLWGRVMENACITSDNVVMSVIKNEDYRLAKAQPDEVSGAVDYLNMVPSTKFSVLVTDDGNGNVKGSFRTRNEDVDLARIAAVFGGGGHSKASGFSMKGKLHEELSYTIVSDDMSKKSLKF